MKLLCIACDEPMKLVESQGPTEGSVALTFGCPRCGQRTALLTNPGETQLVRSLGVQIGGREGAPPPLEMVRSTLARQSAPHSVEEAPGVEGAGPEWTDEALKRLEGAPPFVRPMVKKAVERFARLQGCRQITGEVVEQARNAWDAPGGGPPPGMGHSHDGD
ncbi:MAG: PCP reductase family protein [Dehalococcoidia bacterium]